MNAPSLSRIAHGEARIDLLYPEQRFTKFTAGFRADEVGTPLADRIEIVAGDIRDAAVVDQAMEGIDLVIHCAMALPLYDRADILSTGVNGTRLLLEKSRDMGVKRFVHISSTAVYGIPDERLGEELDGGDRSQRGIRADRDRPIAGTRLIREWRGIENVVTVTSDGFDFEGRPYRSLSAIARAITGTRWNGWVFFGLRRGGRRPAEAPVEPSQRRTHDAQASGRQKNQRGRT